MTEGEQARQERSSAAARKRQRRADRKRKRAGAAAAAESGAAADTGATAEAAGATDDERPLQWQAVRDKSKVKAAAARGPPPLPPLRARGPDEAQNDERSAASGHPKPPVRDGMVDTTPGLSFAHAKSPRDGRGEVQPVAVAALEGAAKPRGSPRLVDAKSVPGAGDEADGSELQYKCQLFPIFRLECRENGELPLKNDDLFSYQRILIC